MLIFRKLMTTKVGNQANLLLFKIFLIFSLDVY